MGIGKNKIDMKRMIMFALLIVCALCANAQGYNTDNVALGKFVQRMYTNAPFQGVKLLEDYDNKYLLSVIILDPAKYGNNESTMNRIAGVKAMSEASRFFNGSQITSDLVITTREDGNKNTTTEMLEKINEQSIGYVNALSQLTNFSDNEGKRVYVFYKQIETLNNNKKRR